MSGQMAIFWPFLAISARLDGQICNFGSEQARDLIFVSTPRFLGMGKHLEPFPEAPDWPEGQEQAVGGQGELRGVTQLPSKRGGGREKGQERLQNNLLTELCYLWTVDYFKYQKNKVIFLCLQNFQWEKNRLNLIYELAIHFTLFSGNCSIVIHLLEEYAYMWVWWHACMQTGKISKTKM